MGTRLRFFSYKSIFSIGGARVSARCLIVSPASSSWRKKVSATLLPVPLAIGPTGETACTSQGSYITRWCKSWANELGNYANLLKNPRFFQEQHLITHFLTVGFFEQGFIRQSFSNTVFNRIGFSTHFWTYTLSHNLLPIFWLNQSILVVIMTGFDIYYIIFRYETGHFFAEKNAIWTPSRNFWKFRHAKNIGRASSYSSVSSV